MLALLLTLWIPLAAAESPQPTCVTAFGQTACGYDCKAAYGRVQCSNVPYGTCHAAYGKVACGPTPLPGAPAFAGWPKATCIDGYGKIACGYNCAMGFGELGCASTPWGQCVAAYGGVTCTSGDASLGFAALSGQQIPVAQCVTAFGKRACGWNCVASRGVVICGATPWAVCEVALNGEAVCSDTPLLLGPSAPAPMRPEVR